MKSESRRLGLQTGQSGIYLADAMDPVTPDNTRVVRLMGDFRQFMASAQMHSDISGQQTDLKPTPLNISAEEQSFSSSRSSKRKLSSDKEEVFFKSKVAQLEYQHAAEEKAHKVAHLNLASKNEKLLSENKALKDRVSSLQLKVNEVTRQAIRIQDELNDTRNLDFSKETNLEESYLQLQKVKDENESMLKLNIAKLKKHCQAFQEQNSQLVLQNSSLQTTLEEKEVLLTQKTARIEKLLEDLNKMGNVEKTARDQQLIISDLEMRLSRAEDAEELSKVMKDDLERLRMLDIEVVKLRAQNEHFRNNEGNILLMKEKMRAVEEKLERNQILLEKSAIIELENRDLVLQLNEAKSREIEQSDIDNSTLVELRQKEVIYVSEIGELKTQSALHNKMLASQKNLIKNLEKNIEEKVELINAKEQEIQSIRKRTILLEGECLSLREFIHSYDDEMVSTPHSEQLMKRVKNEETNSARLHLQLQSALKSGQSSTEEVMALRLQVKDLKDTLSSDKTEQRQDILSDIERLRKKVEELEGEKCALVERNERLELWAGRNVRRGDFDPSVTRVFHFKMNPADLAHTQARKEVAELRAKCRKLEDKIVRLESDQDVTTTCLNGTTVKELEDKLSSSELKNQRLKELFSKKIQDFRRACYTLTGYQIDAKNDDHFKLTSRYSESKNDFLLFSSDTSGGMQLLETDFSKSLDSLIKVHLHHQNSIPMFLSSVTAELFAQQTDVSSRYC